MFGFNGIGCRHMTKVFPWFFLNQSPLDALAKRSVKVANQKLKREGSSDCIKGIKREKEVYILELDCGERSRCFCPLDRREIEEGESSAVKRILKKVSFCCVRVDPFRGGLAHSGK